MVRAVQQTSSQPSFPVLRSFRNHQRYEISSLENNRASVVLHGHCITKSATVIFSRNYSSDRNLNPFHVSYYQDENVVFIGPYGLRGGGDDPESGSSSSSTIPDHTKTIVREEVDRGNIFGRAAAPVLGFFFGKEAGTVVETRKVTFSDGSQTTTVSEAYHVETEEVAPDGQLVVKKNVSKCYGLASSQETHFKDGKVVKTVVADERHTRTIHHSGTQTVSQESGEITTRTSDSPDSTLKERELPDPKDYQESPNSVRPHDQSGPNPTLLEGDKKIVSIETMPAPPIVTGIVAPLLGGAVNALTSLFASSKGANDIGASGAGNAAGNLAQQACEKVAQPIVTTYSDGSVDVETRGLTTVTKAEFDAAGDLKKETQTNFVMNTVIETDYHPNPARQTGSISSLFSITGYVSSLFSSSSPTPSETGSNANSRPSDQNTGSESIHTASPPSTDPHPTNNHICPTTPQEAFMREHIQDHGIDARRNGY